ncbi:MAG: FimB/Mfa2 family fimbrial subunit [Prolixibacteraceae bacterium]|nr:FimB/Mfa2 family fimbrial subunit [Prolixibacteraceae bacterium]
MTTKKMITALLSIAFVILFAACSKKDHDPMLKIRVDNYSLVENITDPNGDYIYPNGAVDDGSPVRVNIYLYDNKGKLYYSETLLTANFAEYADFAVDVKPGIYTIVATADIVETRNGRVIFECWEFANSSLLEEFTIDDLGYIGYHYKMLGVHISTMNVNNDKEITIETESPGALINFLFKNVTDKKIAYIGYMLEISNYYYDVIAEKSVLIEEPLYDGFEVDSDYTGFYNSIYLLEMRNAELSWGTFDVNEDVIATGGATLTVLPGGHKTVTVDISTNKMVSAQLKNSSEKQSLSVKSLKSSKSNVAGKR